MRIVVCLLALCLVSGCAGSRNWSTQDTVLQSIVTGLLVIDAVQTSQIQYHPELEEGGLVARNVLGRQPRTSDTWQYFATVAFTSYVVSYYLPPKWRPFWQGGQIAYETKLIFNNCAHGLGSICEEDHGHPKLRSR